MASHVEHLGGGRGSRAEDDVGRTRTIVRAALAVITVVVMLPTPANAAAAPTNDTADLATEIPGDALPFTDVAQMDGATADSDDDGNVCGRPGATVWYRLTAPSAGRYRIRVDDLGAAAVLRGRPGAFTDRRCTRAAEPSNGTHIAEWQAERGDVAYLLLARGYRHNAPDFGFTVELLPRPSNDAFEDRAVVGSLPVSIDVDTHGATSEPVDASVHCAGLRPHRTVWFELRPAPHERRAVLSLLPFTTFVTVVTGEPGAFYPLGCTGPYVYDVTVEIPADEPAYVVVGTYDDESQYYAGSVRRLTIAPVMSVEVDVRPTGAVHVLSGAAAFVVDVTCSEPVDVWLDVRVGQQQLGGPVWGDADTTATCDTTTPIDLVVEPWAGRFLPGTATVELDVEACGWWTCAEVETTDAVELRDVRL